ncbi:hypothetical protein B484DRAFT_388968, partial [Ochromonadaceae sp. CCMP2298]
MSLTEPMDTIHLSALAILGGLVLLSYAYGLLKGVYARCLRGGKNLKKYGSWAVVTGATDGIGKAMAFEFARKGLNVVLISRSEDKLQACAEELKAKHSVEVKTLAVDYGRFDAATRTTVDFFLKDL